MTMFFLLLALAPATPAKAEGRVSWNVAGDHIEHCKVIKSTGDPKVDGQICAAVACAQKMDVRTEKGELLPYRKEECDRTAAAASKNKP